MQNNLRREKEIADKNAFEEFAEKRKKELEEQKRKAEMKPTEELNKEDAEKAAKNKENIKAAKGWMEFSKKAGKGKLAEMYKNADKGKPENSQWLLDLEEKIKGYLIFRLKNFLFKNHIILIFNLMVFFYYKKMYRIFFFVKFILYF